jgi:hypothetical protein
VTAPLATLQSLAAAVQSALDSADEFVAQLEPWRAEPPKGYETFAAATLLHHLYGAIEDIIERSIKVFDGIEPSGESSHIKMLELAAVEVPGKRPAILSTDPAVDSLRRFRHRFRKRYAVQLDPSLLYPVVVQAVQSWPHVKAQLAVFADFIDDCIRTAQCEP